MSEKQATYLGDGVYAEEDRYLTQIRLYTSNGISETNEIFLEPQSIHKLIKFTDLLWKPKQDVIAHHELKKEWEK